MKINLSEEIFSEGKLSHDWITPLTLSLHNKRNKSKLESYRLITLLLLLIKLSTVMLIVDLKTSLVLELVEKPGYNKNIAH